MAETTAQKLATLHLRKIRYLLAEEKVLLRQSYTIDNRTLTLANLAEIRKAISELDTEINDLENGSSIKVQAVIPLDV